VLGPGHRNPRCADRPNQGLDPLIQDLADIIETLQAAAPGVPIAGMSYWDFFLGYWVTAPDGQALAQVDDVAIQAMNAGLVSTRTRRKESWSRT